MYVKVDLKECWQDLHLYFVNLYCKSMFAALIIQDSIIQLICKD